MFLVLLGLEFLEEIAVAITVMRLNNLDWLQVDGFVVICS